MNTYAATAPRDRRLGRAHHVGCSCCSPWGHQSGAKARERRAWRRAERNAFRREVGALT